MYKLNINTQKENLDVDLIHNFISKSYWGIGRTIEETEICINNSLNFGVYLNNHQIGYARVVTDYCQFAYLLDVFIIESERENGYSKELMNHIMNHDLLKNIKTWRLAISDAHELYLKFGFKPLSKPENLMEKTI